MAKAFHGTMLSPKDLVAARGPATEEASGELKGQARQGKERMARVPAGLRAGPSGRARQNGSRCLEVCIQVVTPPFTWVPDASAESMERKPVHQPFAPPIVFA